jgi:hypothetical protein
MPCFSRRGMVSTDAGVLYPSVNGLVLINSPTPQVVTQDIMTKEEWLRRYDVSSIFATSYGMQYIAFDTESSGFIYSPTEPASKLVDLDQFDEVVGIETDRHSGDVYLIYQDRVWEWDPDGATRMYWRWKSKEFHFPTPLNFGALKIKFNDEDDDVSEDLEARYGPYNEALFATGPLNTINGHAINGIQAAGLVPDLPEAEIRMPINGSLLFPITFLEAQPSTVRFRVYADGEVVYDQIVDNQGLYRLPAGFKRDIYQFEMISNTEVYSAAIAQTARELAKL